MGRAEAYNTLIQSGASDSYATSEFKKVLGQGGTITFEVGSWNIALNKAAHEALADITIQGANTVDPADPDRHGAYDGANVNTILTSKPNTNRKAFIASMNEGVFF